MTSPDILSDERLAEIEARAGQLANTMEWPKAGLDAITMLRDDIPLLLRHARALKAEQQWQLQPIETAPKDGTRVLVTHEKEGWFYVAAFKLQWSDLVRGDMTTWWAWQNMRLDPTHWIPLPNPPEPTDA
jgi:hypothetical protein